MFRVWGLGCRIWAFGLSGWPSRVRHEPRMMLMYPGTRAQTQSAQHKWITDRPCINKSCSSVLLRLALGFRLLQGIAGYRFMFVTMMSRKLKAKQRWEVEEMVFALGSSGGPATLEG